MVHIYLFRCRLLDRDNAHAAVKPLLDSLRYAGCIADDREKDIALVVDQVRVKHPHLEGTGIVIEYPKPTS